MIAITAELGFALAGLGLAAIAAAGAVYAALYARNANFIASEAANSAAKANDIARAANELSLESNKQAKRSADSAEESTQHARRSADAAEVANQRSEEERRAEIARRSAEHEEAKAQDVANRLRACIAAVEEVLRDLSSIQLSHLPPRALAVTSRSREHFQRVVQDDVDSWRGMLARGHRAPDTEFVLRAEHVVSIHRRKLGEFRTSVNSMSRPEDAR